RRRLPGHVLARARRRLALARRPRRLRGARHAEGPPVPFRGMEARPGLKYEPPGVGGGDMEREIVITGIGGQGVQLVAKLLAQAAVREGRQVMTFGMFMGTIRGGSSESTVVVADADIVSPPIVPRLWAVLAMHGAGLPVLVRKVRRGGVLLYNRSLVS